MESFSTAIVCLRYPIIYHIGKIFQFPFYIREMKRTLNTAFKSLIRKKKHWNILQKIVENMWFVKVLTKFLCCLLWEEHSNQRPIRILSNTYGRAFTQKLHHRCLMGAKYDKFLTLFSWNARCSKPCPTWILSKETFKQLFDNVMSNTT